MKHTKQVTYILIAMFLLSQIIGLFVLNNYVDTEKSLLEGKIVFKDLPFHQERPEIEESTSVFWLIIAVLIGTGIALLLFKYNLHLLWKAWFFLAVWICITFAVYAFVSEYVALFVGLFFAIFKVIKPNLYIHNIGELFVYAGIAVILVPIMNIFSGVVMLVVISLYDYWAVFKSKYMVSLVKSQEKTKVFAGLLIPYSLKQIKTKLNTSSNQSTSKNTLKSQNKTQTTSNNSEIAVLGGGDIAFALLFAGIVFKYFGFLGSLLIPLFSTIAISYLLFKGQKGKFYPAMPFISIGCLIGYGLVYLLF